MLLSAHSTQHLSDQLAQIKRSSDEWLLVLLGPDVPVELEALARELKQQNVPAFGGFFTSLVHGDSLVTDRALVRPVQLSGNPALRGGTGWIRPLSPVDQLPPESLSLMLYQPYRVESATLIDEVFGRRAHRTHYLGGGAGRASDDRTEALFCDGRLVDAVVATIPGRWTETLAHGWESVSGPLIATRSEGTRIFELNWEPADKIYLANMPQEVQDKVGHRFDRFLGINYPLALKMRPDGDCVLRPPLEVSDDGSLLVAGVVPENSVIHIAEANATEVAAVCDHLIAAATEKPPTAPPLLLACCGRQLTIGSEALRHELARLTNALPHPLWGAVTLGETASDGQRYVDVHHRALAMSWTYE